MKKNFFVLIVLLTMASCVIAQPSESNRTTVSSNSPEIAQCSKWTFGLQAGATLNSPAAGSAYTNISYDPFVGISYGLSVRYTPFKWLAVRTGINRIAKNYFFSRNNIMGIEGASYGTMVRNTFFDVPLMADLSIGKKVRYHLFLGAYVGFWGKSAMEGEAIPVENVGEVSRFNEQYTFNSIRDNRFDAGLNYGLGISIPCSQRIGIDVDMLWYYGLTDLQKPYMTQLNPIYNTTFLLQVAATYKL